MKKNISIIFNNSPFLKETVVFFCYPLFKLIRILSFPKNYDSKKIVVIAFCRIGDTVFTIPAIKMLKKFYNDVTIFCYQNSKTIYELVLNDINYMVVNESELLFDKRFIKSEFRILLNEINAEKIFDLTGTILSASLIFNSRTKKIIGFNDNYFKPLYSDFLHKRKAPHLIDLYLDPVRMEHNFDETKVEKEYDVSFNQNGTILIHPFAGWAAKEWNLDKFFKLTELLSSDYECLWIFPKEKSNKEFIDTLFGHNIKFQVNNSLNELIQSIKKSSLMISNDSGPIYLANVIGKPTFTIYGPTNPDYSLPYGRFHKFIQNKIVCSPAKNEQYCFTNAGRFCPKYECMNNLSVNEIYEEVIAFMKDIEDMNKTRII